MSFIDSGIERLGKVVKTGYGQWELSSSQGPLHRIDARAKVIFLIFFIVIVSLKREIMPEIAIAFFVFILTWVSRLNIFEFYKKVLFFGFVFGFLTALPSAFNVITKGEIILPVVTLSRPYDLWIYHIPRTIGITKEGMLGVFMLTLRVVNSIALSFLILYTTPFHEIIKALKVFKVPDFILMIITVAYKYIFIFAKTVEDMHLAKKSRMVSGEGNKEAGRWAAGRIAFMFRKTQQRCDDMFKAMLCRGFSDNIRLYGFKKPGSLDWSAGIFFFCAGIIFLWI
jgi:cobalt ECF transporter T component CbiQ